MPNPDRSVVKIGCTGLPVARRSASRSSSARINDPRSRSILTNGAITARTLSVPTSPPKTPESKGAASRSRTSPPKWRSVKLAIDSSLVGAARCSSPARSSSFRNACRASGESSGEPSIASSAARDVGTIIRMPSGSGSSLPSISRCVLRVASFETMTSSCKPSSVASSRAAGFSLTQESGPSSITKPSCRIVSTIPPVRPVASNSLTCGGSGTARVNCQAAVSPLTPAPTIATRFMAGQAMTLSL